MSLPSSYFARLVDATTLVHPLPSPSLFGGGGSLSSSSAALGTYLQPYNESTAQVGVLIDSFEWLGAAIAIVFGVVNVVALIYLHVGGKESNVVEEAVGRSPLMLDTSIPLRRLLKHTLSVMFGVIGVTARVCRSVSSSNSTVGGPAPSSDHHRRLQKVNEAPRVGFLPKPAEPEANGCHPRALSSNHGLRHLAVIMDGNRRYGKRMVEAADCSGASLEGSPTSSYAALKSLATSPLNGHRAGGEKLMEFIRYCIRHHIQMLSVYAFSTENWNRSEREIDILMCLFEHFFEQIRNESRHHGIFIRFIATEPQLLPPHILALMRDVENETRRISPRNIVVNCCVSYGGRSEIVHACRRILLRRLNATHSAITEPLSVDCISEDALQKEMLRSITQDDHELEDEAVVQQCGGCEPQVLLRTSGEARTSNFLLYETAYTELVFVDKTWPEIHESDVEEVIEEFCRRQRRFGK